MGYECRTRESFHLVIDGEGLREAVEVGLGAGGNARYLLSASGLRRLTCVDNWSVRSVRASAESTLKSMEPFKERFRFMLSDSVKAAESFGDGSLDYVYIDGDHRLAGCSRDLKAWWPKVRPGGFFGGHDYLMCRKCDVKLAVDEFFASLGRGFSVTSEPLPSFWLIK